MSYKRYGIPYLGGKWRLAPWIFGYLPDTDVSSNAAGERERERERERVFVDLFAGGCAMTQYALESGRFDRVIANDLSVAPSVWVKAVDVGTADWEHWVTKEEFKKLSTEDVDGLAQRIIFGFGMKSSTYGYSDETQRKLRPIFEAWLYDGVPIPSGMKVQCKCCVKWFRSLRGVVDTSCVDVVRCDYRDVVIPDGAVVYADPPYRGTEMHYGSSSSFDSAAFDEWLGDCGHIVLVSEQSCPKDCICIAKNVRVSTLAGGAYSSVKSDDLFVHRRHFNAYRDLMAAKGVDIVPIDFN